MLAARLVAFAALCFAVFAEQREVGEIMVEGLFVELRDVGVPAFMVGMAGRAAGIASLVRQAMKP